MKGLGYLGNTSVKGKGKDKPIKKSTMFSKGK